MKVISKAVAAASVGAMLIGGGTVVAVAISGAPAAARPAPVAVSALEYGL
jgi:hypothetical protein